MGMYGQRNVLADLFPKKKEVEEEAWYTQEDNSGCIEGTWSPVREKLSLGTLGPVFPG